MKVSVSEGFSTEVNTVKIDKIAVSIWLVLISPLLNKVSGIVVIVNAKNIMKKIPVKRSCFLNVCCLC